MSSLSPSKSKQEEKYIQILKKHPGQVYLAKDHAPQEGFEYFASSVYRRKINQKGSLLTDKLTAMPLNKLPRLAGIFIKNIVGIFDGRRRSFTDISDYLDDLQATGQVEKDSRHYLATYPNSGLWQSLSDYAWTKWRVKFGFTEVPPELIFKNKAILFNYALVAIQEMDKEKINTAPDLDAGEEVLAVYNSLGLAVNDIARWLRKNYGILCQANHPLGGLVNTVPLAVKAGMGWCGYNGLLITPEYGQRQRIAPIFIDAPIFEYSDSDSHRWIDEFCAHCHLCQKACPTGAILDHSIIGPEVIPGLGPARTSINRERCYPYFNETLGCSICVKVCPFSRANGAYERLKKSGEKTTITMNTDQGL